MPIVGAAAAPHSHLQLFTRPAENDDYKARVNKGRAAMFVLREQIKKSGADTLFVIHDDHFVNFDFRCYPPFAIFIGEEASGSGVTSPDEIERITGATYRRYAGKAEYESAPSGIPQHMANWEKQKPYVYKSSLDLSTRLLKGLMEQGFDLPFTTDGTMDGEHVLTMNFLNPSADLDLVLFYTNGYVPPLPWPRRCLQLGEAIREIIEASDKRVFVFATGGMSHFPGTPLYGHVDEDFDQKMLQIFADGDIEALRSLTPDDLMNHGDGELVNWIITAGMMGKRKAKVVDYIRLWHIGLGYLYWEM